MLKFWQNYQDIQKKLDLVQSLMIERLKINDSDLQEVLEKSINQGGKMVRPALFLIFTQVFDKESQHKKQEDYIKIATSLELLHLATLVHDDIIDDSSLRRGSETVQSQFGKDVAVYTGDFIYTIYFELLCETMIDTPFLLRNAKSMKKILQGELIQKQGTFNTEISIHKYLKAISGKTAELLSLACLEGAYFAGADRAMQHSAKKIGLAIGLAFQIYDDILNFTIDTKASNKPVLTDVKQGIFTLPLLLAKETAPEQIRPYMEKAKDLTDEECLNLAHLVEELGGIKQSMELANGLTNLALAEIDKLPQSPYRETLNQATQLLLKRKY